MNELNFLCLVIGNGYYDAVGEFCFLHYFIPGTCRAQLLRVYYVCYVFSTDLRWCPCLSLSMNALAVPRETLCVSVSYLSPFYLQSYEK